MNLKQVKSKPFDEILYSSIKKINNLPDKLSKTDEFFFKSTLEIYKEIEKEKIIAFNPKEKTGYSTAINLIASYYTFNNKDITFINIPGLYKELFFNVYDLFTSFIDFDYEKNFKLNEYKLSYNNIEYCNLKFLGDLNFNIADLKGIVIFDVNRNMTNIDKYKDILKNISKFDKLIIKFTESEELKELIKLNNIKNKEIKIL